VDSAKGFKVPPRRRFVALACGARAKIVDYSMKRDFGRDYVDGPVADQDALHLTAALKGQFCSLRYSCFFAPRRWSLPGLS
jgi:hypothetical protein